MQKLGTVLEQIFAALVGLMVLGAIYGVPIYAVVALSYTLYAAPLPTWVRIGDAFALVICLVYLLLLFLVVSAGKRK